MYLHIICKTKKYITIQCRHVPFTKILTLTKWIEFLIMDLINMYNIHMHSNTIDDSYPKMLFKIIIRINRIKFQNNSFCVLTCNLFHQIKTMKFTWWKNSSCNKLNWLWNQIQNSESLMVLRNSLHRKLYKKCKNNIFLELYR